MSHYYGYLQNNVSKQVTKGGTKSAGLNALLSTHNSGSISTRLYWRDDEDHIAIEIVGGNGISRDIYRGPLALLWRIAQHPDLLRRAFTAQLLVKSDGQ